MGGVECVLHRVEDVAVVLVQLVQDVVPVRVARCPIKSGEFMFFGRKFFGLPEKCRWPETKNLSVNVNKFSFFKM